MIKSKNNKKQRLDSLFINIQGTIVLTILSFLIYSKVPHFETMLGTDGIKALDYFFFIYLFLNIGYFIYCYIRKISLENTKISLIYKFLGNSISKNKVKFDTKEIKTAFLSTLIKFFFFPIMFSSFVANFPTLKVTLTNVFSGNISYLKNFDTLYNVLINCIFFFDTLIFAFGYAFEAKELKNIIKSVEPTFFGWFIALIAYPPFNRHTSDFLNNLSPLLFGRVSSLNILTQAPQLESTVATLLKAATLVCYLIYVIATFSLGAKSSNLTNRGIVSKGAYGVVRHPAYISKNMAWWLEGFSSGLNLGKVINLIGWNIIYYFRARTEENHLSSDKDFVDYKKKVKWMFIPGIV